MIPIIPSRAHIAYVVVEGACNRGVFWGRGATNTLPGPWGGNRGFMRLCGRLWGRRRQLNGLSYPFREVGQAN